MYNTSAIAMCNNVRNTNSVGMCNNVILVLYSLLAASIQVVSWYCVPNTLYIKMHLYIIDTYMC